MGKISIDGAKEAADKAKHRAHAIGLIGLAAVILLIGGVSIYRASWRNSQQPTANNQQPTRRPLPKVANQSPSGSQPKSKEFGLVIDKINANAPIVKEVDPNSDSAYYKALEQGVAHWRGTAYPDQPGNMFIFGHSSFYAAAKGDYKDIFAPLDKVEKGEKFDIWYNSAKYTYEVVDNKVVADDDFSVLDGPTPDDKNDKTITIMTCWPPKTIAKRRVVFGKQV